MELILISAMTADRVIGRGSGMPWDLPDEYAHFRSLVRGCPVVFGRVSFEIFGPDLPDSRLIVVSSTLGPAEAGPGVTVCRSVDDAVMAAAETGASRAFSAGGASIYRQTLPLADAMFLSFVKRRHDGDARFPDFDEGDWRVERTEDHPHWEFRVYRRRRPARLEGRG